MKSKYLLQFFLMFSFTCGYAQNAYYDAAWLKAHLINNVFNSEASYNKQQDSLESLRTLIRQKRGAFRNNDDSSAKYIAQDREVDALLTIVLESKDDSLFNLLMKYFPEITPSSTSDDVTQIIRRNPFFENFSVKGAVRGRGNPVRSLGISNIMQTVGGMDVTKYADVVADIMIERAKQELTVAFFNRFKRLSEQNPEFTILFPKTTENLSSLLTYKYPQMLPLLRTGFFADLKQITYHLDDLMDHPRYQTLLRNYPEVRVAIRSLRLVHELETGASNAADIIDEFALFEEWNDPNNITMRSVGSCVQISAFFSKSIRVDRRIDSGEHIWVPAKKLKQLFHDKLLFDVYMGLLYQQSITSRINYVAANGQTTALSLILAEQKQNLFLFQNKLKEFIDLTGNVNTAFSDYRSDRQNNIKPDHNDIFNYINTSIDIVDFGFGIVRIFHKAPVAENYIALLRKSNNLYKSIYSTRYTQAVNDALDMLNMFGELTNEKINLQQIKSAQSVKDNANANTSVRALVRGNRVAVTDIEIVDNEIDDANVDQLVEHYRIKQLMDFVRRVKPYALFMANVVESENEEQMKSALESVILPVGSSSIKKNTQCNLSVQSYLGAYLSVSGRRNALEGAWSDRFGVTAPVGLSWTPGFLSWQKGGSLSLFTALVDIGAIVDYKLQKEPDPTSTDPNATVITKDYKIELGQIFSPGVYAVYGIGGNLPLSVGFGAQYGPGLSRIEADNNTVITNPSVRWNFFLAVDLPFFNLINKPKNRQY